MATSEHRDNLGRLVREAWVKWAHTQQNPKLSWLAPYDELSEPDKEADRQIGEALFDAGQNAPRVIVASDDDMTFFFQCSGCGLDACVTGVPFYQDAKRLLTHQTGWEDEYGDVYCNACAEERQDERSTIGVSW